MQEQIIELVAAGPGVRHSLRWLRDMRWAVVGKPLAKVAGTTPLRGGRWLGN